MKEIWKDIVGYEGRYQISNLGNVLCLNYKNTHKPHLLSIFTTKTGYNQIHLTKANKQSRFFVHVLVAKAFIPNPYNKPQVNHIDGNKQNNCVDNLEWVTAKENIEHAMQNGLIRSIKYFDAFASRHTINESVLQYDLHGNFIKKWKYLIEASKYYQCDPNLIKKCMKGYTKSAKGFIWKENTNPIPLKIEAVQHHLSPYIVEQYTKDGKTLIRTWNNYNEIIKANPSYSKKNLSMCCQGASKTAYGYIWKRKLI